MALRNNKEIQQATLNIEKAGYQRREASASDFPFASAQGCVTP